MKAENTDEDLTFDGQPRCRATSKQTGERCRRAATPGIHVCANHGSRTPGARKTIAFNLAALATPAIATLAREMANAATSADRLKAANSILDRAGYGRVSKIEATDAREMLLNRLVAIRDQSEAEDYAVSLADPERLTAEISVVSESRIQEELEELL